MKVVTGGIDEERISIQIATANKRRYQVHITVVEKRNIGPGNYRARVRRPRFPHNIIRQFNIADRRTVLLIIDYRSSIIVKGTIIQTGMRTTSIWIICKARQYR